MFTILFGISFAVQLTRASQRAQSLVPVYSRRLGILLLIGVLHFTLLWFGDILHIYALCGFVLLLFRHQSDRAVLGWALGLFAFFLLLPVLSLAADKLGVPMWRADHQWMPQEERFAKLTGWRMV